MSSRQQSAINRANRRKNTPDIIAFCEDNGLKIEFIHGFEWHARIEGVMDVFPSTNKYHMLKTDQRGSFKDYEELGQLFTEYMEELS